MGSMQKAFAFALVLLVCIQLISFLALVTSLRITRSSTNKKVAKNICLECIDLRGSAHTGAVNDDQIYAQLSTENSSICCGDLNTLSKVFFEKQTLQQYNGNKIPGHHRKVYNNSCALESKGEILLARLVGVIDHQPSDIVSGHWKLLWMQDGTTQKCRHLIKEGELFITKAGYYVVYSTLNVKTLDSDISPGVNHLESEVFIHQLGRYSHQFGTRDVLAQSHKTVPKRNSTQFNSVVSAVFKLNLYDRISVSVNYPGFVARQTPGDQFYAYYTYDFDA